MWIVFVSKVKSQTRQLTPNIVNSRLKRCEMTMTVNYCASPSTVNSNNPISTISTTDHAAKAKSTLVSGNTKSNSSNHGPHQKTLQTPLTRRLLLLFFLQRRRRPASIDGRPKGDGETNAFRGEAIERRGGCVSGWWEAVEDGVSYFI